MRQFCLLLTLFSAGAAAATGPIDGKQLRAAHDQYLHRVTPQGIAYNPGQQWNARFDGQGFTVSPKTSGWTWGLTLERFGWAGQTQAAGVAQMRTEGNRVTYTRPGVEEWFVNDQRGLEQGFTVHAPPVGSGRTLVFDMAVRGGLRPRVQEREVWFGERVRFSGLRAWDATGRELAASFQATPEGFRYRVEAVGARFPVTVDPVAQQAYVKASNTGPGDVFGSAVAISGDTMVVGAPSESSDATGVGGPDNNNALLSGAAYVYVRTGTTWTQQAYLKASNTGAGDRFGTSVAISGDTIVVGASGEASNGSGQGNNGALGAGAAYVFTRTGTTWTQQAYLKASNPDPADLFGGSVGIAGDTIVVGATGESSNATGVGGGQGNSLLTTGSGAAYVFSRTGTTWTQQAYLKASNTGALDAFGGSVSVSGDTVVVGAANEGSNATGVGGAQNNNLALLSGAAYVFTRTGTTWTQQAYLKASNTGAGDLFGRSSAVSGDTIVVGARNEGSDATGVNGANNNNALLSGAAYVFTRTGTTWTQQAYLKASNTGAGDLFGASVAISGNYIAIGAPSEGSDATGVDGPNNNNALLSGAAYVFLRNGTNWAQQAYLKASNTGLGDLFGTDVAVANNTVVTGAPSEGSNATGINGDGTNDNALLSGAAYVFSLPITITATAGDSQSTIIGTAFLTNLQATVTDVNGNPVGGVTVTFTAPNAGASGTFPGGLLTATATTNASGVATAPIFTANNTIGGPYNVVASASGADTPANFALRNLTNLVQITLQTNVPGPQLSVDGGAPFTPPQTFNWVIGSTHTITTTSPQLFNGGLSRYVFQSWSDAGAISHTITTPNIATTFTATFGVEHQVTFNALPAAGGTITPASGFYTQVTVLTVTATPNANYTFAGFTGALTGLTNPQLLAVTGPRTVNAIFLADGAYQVRYMSGLNQADSVINLTNTGARGAGLAAGTTAATTGAICVNVYAFSPDEQMVSCCSCPVTPNGLASLSGRNDLTSNTLTPAVPTSIVVKLVATVPDGGSCANSAANIGLANLAPGLAAWGTTVKTAPNNGLAIVETPFLPATPSFGGAGLDIGELERLRQLCNFINSNGSGFGVCRSCRLGGLGAGRI
ncbi:MAG: Ig-like domain-containing protein [Bryobacteraceae bacterium]|nr:Ig-like domain-containing protein [Bryobacteraceae bacterium]